MIWSLGPYQRDCKTYQDYLSTLPKDISLEIKQNWKNLHKNLNIKLGDYLNINEAPNLPIDDKIKAKILKLNSQILTFELDGKALGCLIMTKGKNGNFFFEPFVFETNPEPLIPEVLYSQYALLKFFEFPEARKCHLLRNNAKIVFDHKDDSLQFELQSFKVFELEQTFSSRLKRLEKYTRF